jgi:plasmid maintenance system antidote protein VapI
MVLLSKKMPPLDRVLWDEVLKPKRVSKSDYSKLLGGSWTHTKLSAIIRGKQKITEIVALNFADAIGTNSERPVISRNHYLKGSHA